MRIKTSIYILYGSNTEQFHTYAFEDSLLKTLDASIERFNNLTDILEYHIIQVSIDLDIAIAYNLNISKKTVVSIGSNSEFINTLFYEEVLDL